MNLFRSEFYVEGLGAHRIADKLSAAGIEVLSLRRTQKNAALVQVAAKDRKKVFAILRGSCYNVKKVRPRGLSRALAYCMRSAGLVLGAALFLLAAIAVETRVLRIDVVGSGAYYEDEVREILSQKGVAFFSAAPKEIAPIRAEILNLPRVSFCSVRTNGGILTVTVEVSDDLKPLLGEPLLAPASGRVEEIIVVRGTARAAVGDSVQAGDVVVDSVAPVGEEWRPVIVIAEVKVSFPFAREYALSEEKALAQAALDFGEIKELHTTKTENGCLVEGTACVTAAINLG